MIILVNVLIILFISGILILGIDASVNAGRHEKWMWQLVLVSRARSANFFGMNLEELEKDPDSLLPSESVRLLFTRIWGMQYVPLFSVNWMIRIHKVIWYLTPYMKTNPMLKSYGELMEKGQIHCRRQDGSHFHLIWINLNIAYTAPEELWIQKQILLK